VCMFSVNSKGSEYMLIFNYCVSVCVCVRAGSHVCICRCMTVLTV